MCTCVFVCCVCLCVHAQSKELCTKGQSRAMLLGSATGEGRDNVGLGQSAMPLVCASTAHVAGSETGTLPTLTTRELDSSLRWHWPERAGWPLISAHTWAAVTLCPFHATLILLHVGPRGAEKCS